jgi:hypothetical protein
MSWLRRFIHRWMGHDRYHEQANAVNVRHFRQALLSKQLEVIERRGKSR